MQGEGRRAEAKRKTKGLSFSPLASVYPSVQLSGRVVVNVRCTLSLSCFEFSSVSLSFSSQYRGSFTQLLVLLVAVCRLKLESWTQSYQVSTTPFLKEEEQEQKPSFALPCSVRKLLWICVDPSATVCHCADVVLKFFLFFHRGFSSFPLGPKRSLAMQRAIAAS